MKLYTHDWEVKHDELEGFTQATGLQLTQKVFRFWKFRVVTDTQLWTGGEWVRKLGDRIEKDKIQQKQELKNKL